jgi:hypothetical protein
MPDDAGDVCTAQLVGVFFQQPHSASMNSAAANGHTRNRAWPRWRFCRAGPCLTYLLAGMVGHDFFKRYAVTFDFENMKIVLQ